MQYTPVWARMERRIGNVFYYYLCLLDLVRGLGDVELVRHGCGRRDVLLFSFRENQGSKTEGVERGITTAL